MGSHHFLLLLLTLQLWHEVCLLVTIAHTAALPGNVSSEPPKARHRPSPRNRLDRLPAQFWVWQSGLFTSGLFTQSLMPLLVTAGKESVAASFSGKTRHARLYGCTNQAEGTTLPLTCRCFFIPMPEVFSGPALKRICTGYSRVPQPVASALLKKSSGPPSAAFFMLCHFLLPFTGHV